MKYCSHCGNQVEDAAVICTKCGCMVEGALPVQKPESKGPKTVSILALIFGALGGLAGIVLGIIGLAIDKEKKYRTYNILGIVLGAAWWIIIILLNSY